MHHKKTNTAENKDFVRLFGFHGVSAALKNKNRVCRKLLGTRNALNRINDEVIALDSLNIAVEEVSAKDISRQLAPDNVHNGIMLIAEPLEEVRLDEIPLNGPLILLDQVTDPHNVGAILRTAAAFGVSAVITTWRHSPVADGVLAKSASGGLEYVPYLRISNLSDAMSKLKARGVTMIGLAGEGEQNLASLKVDSPFAIVMGAEGKGLRQKTRHLCDVLAYLPLPGELQVLNVSNAAAISLYALSM